MVRYINLDNAASTPPLREVADVMQDFLRFYSSVHRGESLVAVEEKFVPSRDPRSVARGGLSPSEAGT